MKKLGESVKKIKTADWQKEAPTIALNEVMAKFEQNPDMLKILLEMGDKSLVEASKLCGIGVHLYDRDIIKKKNT